MAEMKPVQSSAISEVGYDSKTHMMRVHFRNGDLYPSISVVGRSERDSSRGDSTHC